MKVTIKHVEINLRHYTRPDAPVWYIFLNEKGEPLHVSPPGYTVTPGQWIHASLFSEARVAEVQELLGPGVRSVTMASYLDELMDQMIREERRIAGGAIHEN